MEHQLNEYMVKAFDFEENGYVKEALQLCDKCLQVFPEYRDEIELEIAKMYYRNEKKEYALLLFLEILKRTQSSDILWLILDAYYHNNIQEYSLQYQENCRQLEKYPYFFGQKISGNLDEIRFLPLLFGEKAIYYYDKTDKILKAMPKIKSSQEQLKEGVCAAFHVLCKEDILIIEEATRIRNPFMDNENAVFLVYDKETWELFLQLIDIRELAEYDRMVLFDSHENLKKALISGRVEFPDIFVCENPEKTGKLISDAYHAFVRNYKEIQEKLVGYYEENAQTVMEHIQNGNPRILFQTSRYTTALQYHMRDCMEAAQRLGLQTEILIEENRLRMGISYAVIAQVLAEFKPDIIFIIDHFRFEYELYQKLKQIVFIGWVQDPMPDIMDVHAPEKLISRDIVLTHYITWKVFQEIGYDARCVIDAPIPANAEIYKKYELTSLEKEKYSCDICFVCHAADVEGFLKEELLQFPEEHQNQLYEIYKGYQKYVLLTGNFFRTEEECRQFIEGALWQHYAVRFPAGSLKPAAYQMYLRYNEVLYRQALADWLIEAGYTNIKLWGSGWQNDIKYAEYAMGPAKNGETLSKIYQASKIVIGNTFHATGSARAWESMLSGAFYMSNFVPPDIDSVDIRKIMKADEELVMFYGKEDFLSKIGYFLTHEEERMKMAEIGHKAALERMTYDILIKRVITELPERLKLLQQGENAERI